ncbi:ATP-binding protein [Streptomyces benahoarensis]|uniref:Regulator n=1 Tax=Streptomyces benahoarensis TaxID=2595054 RepID=A0A553YW90_9ACTN|nr:regulator [Streptomyces benahoarensis]TSB33263.1 regulator [Streptomyces benahoarensis]
MPVDERSVHNDISGQVLGPSVQAGIIHGDVYIGSQEPVLPPTPWQLPPAAPLTDRSDELLFLKRRRDHCVHRGHPFLAAISGLGGVGKTALALDWLHSLRPSLPGGQLYADLGARSPSGPVDPAETLSRFLRGLGTPPQQVPHTLAERAALYRSLTSRRPVAVLLDDAESAAHVRPLLPGGNSVTLVTSRGHLTGLTLEGGHQLHLEPLAPDDAVQLLADTLGDRRVAERPDEARALVGLCAGLPLAVRVVGARLAARPRRSIAMMVGALSEERGRLDALAIDGDRSVRAALDLSYRGLPAEAARLYRLLGTHPGRHFDDGLAAALLAPTGATVGEAADLLDVLHDTHLLTETGEDRYRFHDLVRLHALARAEEDEPAAERAGALRRIAGHYLALATRAEHAIEPRRPTLERDPASREVHSAPFGDRDAEAALDWLERELPDLVAVIRRVGTTDFPWFGWQLADALWPLFPRRKHYDQWRAVHGEGLAAAEEYGDRAAQARMLTSGGLGELGCGEHDRALEMFEAAAGILARDGDALGHARTLNYRGLALQRRGEPEAAAALFARAAAELPRHGDPRAGGLARLNAAGIALDAARPEEAAAAARAAREVLCEADDPYNAARATTLLGRARLLAGVAEEAEVLLSEALAVLRGVDAGYEVARALEALAEIAGDRGETPVARARYAEALDLYVGVNRTERADAVRARLAALDAAG